MQELERAGEDRLLTRRGFAMLVPAGLIAAGVGSLTLAQVSAREAEPGDDRGGHGNDDPLGDDRGGNGNDDPPGDDHGRHHRHRRRGHN
jgi:hypothetical protein